MAEDLESDKLPETETLVVWDELGAGNGGLIAVIQPEEAGTDCSPKYDEALGLIELSNQGFITALRKSRLSCPT